MLQRALPEMRTEVRQQLKYDELKRDLKELMNAIKSKLVNFEQTHRPSVRRNQEKAPGPRMIAGIRLILRRVAGEQVSRRQG